ncbi:hypothetical protein QFZ24_000316 [Streptomyces phaeochromogenes]|jgi:hypothetical protein|uniref:hypothetical protein n=1 Tax=Streptomyces phaeochromogenes TaxID=1923 RepID=UPI00278D8D9D|nr:hypothetical protein [Streptomyces phaeochromogenes]MDQ0946393.1 hypothetical protein [Streptomyces phaeochromogenes]
MVADSKLVSYANVCALLAAEVDFGAPVPASQVKDEVYAALNLDQAAVVDWTPERDAGKKAEQREMYRVLEDTHTLNGPRKSDPVLRLRRILVHSTANVAGQQAARDKRLAKAAEDLDKLAGAAGGRHYKTAEKIIARIGVIAAKRRVVSCLRFHVTENNPGVPALTWHFDQEVLEAEAAVDGWYALLTTLPVQKADPGQVLIHYKGQGAVERRYADFKGPPGGCAGLRPSQPARRRPHPGHLPGSAGVLSDRAAGRTRARTGPVHDRPLPGQSPSPPHRPHDLLPSRRTHPADRPHHRSAHRPDHPWRPTPHPRSPRHRHRANPLAADLKR